MTTTLTNMRRPTRRFAALAVVLVAAALGGACGEQLDGGGNCAGAALLCPGQSVEFRDTIIDPTLTFDSTFVGFPTRGAEFSIPLISRGNDLETVGIIRFDTLVTLFVPPGDTITAITYVDSTFLKLYINTEGAELPDSVRFDLYDVTVKPDDDTSAAPVLARFVPQWKIGGKTFAKADLVDSVLLPVSDSAMLKHLADSSFGWPRLRLGVRVSGAGTVSLRLGTVEAGVPPVLYYRPKNDTAVHQLDVLPASGGPLERADIQRDLLDYGLVLKSNFPTLPATMGLGGVPGRRVYLRFNLPVKLTDSSTILRATLRLNQVPYPIGSAKDTVVVHPHIVLAGPQVTDHRRATTLIGPPGAILTDSLILSPNGSGLRELEMYPLVRAWGAQGTGANVPPRAIVLSASNEGVLARMVTFSSTNAAAGLRPRMRITYIPKLDFGRP
jgi:hypothetical protein